MKRPERDYDLAEWLVEVLGEEGFRNELLQALDKDVMNEHLDHIAQMHDIKKGEDDES